MKFICNDEVVTFETLLEYYEEQKEYSLSIGEKPLKLFKYLSNLEEAGLLQLVNKF